MNERRDGSEKNEPVQPTQERCSECQQLGGVIVVPFRWGAESHLRWQCRDCGHIWISRERRQRRDDE